MNPRAVARAATVAGWGAGLALILSGLPLPLALAVPVVTIGCAFAWARWGAGTLAGLKAAVQLKRLIKRAVKTGEAVEHA